MAHNEAIRDTEALLPRGRAVGRLNYEDTAYFFCTLACAAEFAA